MAGGERGQGEGGPQDFADQASAIKQLEDALRQKAISSAQTAGVADLQVNAIRDIRTTSVESRQVFIEAVITVEATGRPRIANG